MSKKNPVLYQNTFVKPKMHMSMYSVIPLYVGGLYISVEKIQRLASNRAFSSAASLLMFSDFIRYMLGTHSMQHTHR